MYEEYIGKIFDREEDIWRTFKGHWIVCEYARKFIIKYVGKTYEEVREWLDKNPYNIYEQTYIILQGSLPRKGTKIISNSSITMEEIIGEWHALGVDRDIEHTFIFLPTGKAIHAETLYDEIIYIDMDWFVEDDIFTIESAFEYLAYQGKIIYRNHTDEQLHCFSSLELENCNTSLRHDWFPSSRLYKQKSLLPYPGRVEKCQQDYELYKKWGHYPSY